MTRLGDAIMNNQSSLAGASSERPATMETIDAEQVINFILPLRGDGLTIPFVESIRYDLCDKGHLHFTMQLANGIALGKVTETQHHEVSVDLVAQALVEAQRQWEDDARDVPGGMYL